MVINVYMVTDKSVDKIVKGLVNKGVRGTVDSRSIREHLIYFVYKDYLLIVVIHPRCFFPTEPH